MCSTGTSTCHSFAVLTGYSGHLWQRGPVCTDEGRTRLLDLVGQADRDQDKPVPVYLQKYGKLALLEGPQPAAVTTKPVLLQEDCSHGGCFRATAYEVLGLRWAHEMHFWMQVCTPLSCNSSNAGALLCRTVKWPLLHAAIPVVIRMMVMHDADAGPCLEHS
jgi:hypothetical protein